MLPLSLRTFFHQSCIPEKSQWHFEGELSTFGFSLNMLVDQTPGQFPLLYSYGVRTYQNCFAWTKILAMCQAYWKLYKEK